MRPAAIHLDSYRAALQRGWSPSTSDPSRATRDLTQIDTNPTAFLAAQDDPEGGGEPITLSDGSRVPRLPGYHRWMWAEEFLGVIDVRWQPGTETLPPHVLGHIGYAVVPWKRRQGYATAALRELLPQVRELGLVYVELTTDTDNIASQQVITSNGGVLIEQFTKPATYGLPGPARRWRIPLTE